MKTLLNLLNPFKRNKVNKKRFTIKAGWTDLSKEKSKSTRKAMNLYRKSHPHCEITGTTKKIQIHHIVPVWADPDLADHPDNFIALSASAHIHHIYGHDRNFSQKYVKNIREISKKMLDLREELDIIHRS